MLEAGSCLHRYVQKSSFPMSFEHFYKCVISNSYLGAKIYYDLLRLTLLIC